MRKIIFFSFLIISFSLFINVGNAQTIWKQQLINTTVHTSNNVEFQYLGSGDNTVINSASIYVDNTEFGAVDSSSPRTVALVTCEGTWNEVSGTCSGASYNATNISTFNILAGEAKWYTSTFDATTTNPSYEYAININLNTPNSAYVTGSINDVYSDGSFEGEVHTILDIAFQVGTDLSPIQPNTINITYPINGSSVTFFNNFEVEWNYPSVSPSTDLWIRWATSTELLNNFSLNTYNILKDMPSVTGTTTVAHQCLGSSFGKYPCPEPIGDYYVQAYIRDGLQTIASSTIISYSLISSGSYEPEISVDIGFDADFYFATTTGAFSDQCDQFGGSGWFGWGSVGYGGCKLLVFMFVPHDISLDFMQSTISLFQNVFPFSVYYDFTNAVKNSILASEDNEGLTVSIDLSSVFPTMTSLNILTPTLLEDLVGTTTKNNIFQIQAYLIWLLTGLVIVKSIT